MPMAHIQQDTGDMGRFMAYISKLLAMRPDKLDNQ